MSPFWAKKLEEKKIAAKNAKKKKKILSKKDDHVQDLPNLRELTVPIPNRSTQRAMHQYRKSNCFRYKKQRTKENMPFTDFIVVIQALTLYSLHTGNVFLQNGTTRCSTERIFSD